MKKQQKAKRSLKLNKEDLVLLNPPELQKVVGGLSFVGCDTFRTNCM